MNMQVCQIRVLRAKRRAVARAGASVEVGNCMAPISGGLNTVRAEPRQGQDYGGCGDFSLTGDALQGGMGSEQTTCITIC